jgi:hypothetical protein
MKKWQAVFYEKNSDTITVLDEDDDETVLFERMRGKWPKTNFPHASRVGTMCAPALLSNFELVERYGLEEASEDMRGYGDIPSQTDALRNELLLRLSK